MLRKVATLIVICLVPNLNKTLFNPVYFIAEIIIFSRATYPP